MRLIRFPVAVFASVLLACQASSATKLVTGNGFGFAVVSPQTGAVTRFYSHPYSFVRPDPQKPLSEGIETTNFIKNLEVNSATAGSVSVDYEEDSHVIHTQSASCDSFVFMPFGLRQPALIIVSQPRREPRASSPFAIEWNRLVKSQSIVHVAGLEVRLLRFDGTDEVLALVALARIHVDTSLPGQVLSGSPAWALISIEDEKNIVSIIREFDQWRAGRTPRELTQREIALLEQWRVKPSFSFASENARHLWRQSEAMLRMAQSREPNRIGRHSNGMIVASMPDGVWFTPWVRDMAWATVALVRMGHREEARAALMAYFNAQPTGKMRSQTAGADYQISVVRYFGDGSEEPFFTEEGSTNIEFDDWGEALWVLGEYLEKYNDPGLLHMATCRGPLYESARDFIMKPLLANLEPFSRGEIVAADTSIWEEHQKDRKHFAFSTAAAIVGLSDFAEISQRAGDQSTQTEAMKHVALLKTGFGAAFIRNGQLHGTLEEGEKNDIDGALLAIIHFGVVTDPAIIRDTSNRMDLLKVVSGGYKRVRSNYTDPAIFEYWYERQEFLFVDFSIAEVYRRMGRKDEATAMIERIVSKAAADHNIIPEMYVAVPCPLFPGKIGDPTGARPMVGYGAGEYILDVLDQQRR